MKKILIFMLAIFTCALCMPKASASAPGEEYSIYEDIEDYKETKVCEPNVDMNVMKGVSSRYIIYTAIFDKVAYLGDSVEEGSAICTVHFTYGDKQFDIEAEYVVDGAYIFQIIYRYNGETFYEVEFEPQFGVPTVTINKEFHPIDIFKTYSATCHFTGVDVRYENMLYLPGCDESCYNEVNWAKNALGLLRGSVIKYNTAYDGKECHLVTEEANPKPIETLLEGMKITDLSDGEISNYQIVNNEYNHTNAPIGAYKATIIAKDKAGNVVIQDVIINVVDGIGPAIVAGTITLSYTNPLSAEQLKEKISVTDNKGVKSVEITCPEYLASPAELGSYAYKVVAIDTNDNRAEASGTIVVEDDIAPVLSVSDISVDTPYALLTEDDVKQRISAIDAKEGEIDKKSITLKGYDTYASNYQKLGKYKIEVSVSDSKGNPANSEFYIYIVDKNFPEIEFETGVITINQGDVLSKDLIISMLKQTGQIPGEVNIVAVRSSFFDEENPSGQYDVEIELEGGQILKEIINVIEKPKPDEPELGKPEIDYNEPDKKDKNDYNNIAIATMVTLFGAALAGAVIIFVKKRH